ncbi:type I-E CRISPR-associated protein Cse1/CasA [Streptomyces sp. NBC_00102]|uniref:type I-E CRISPR-associated protein Cse1/CasA n=1 Tax=Streptomyces sp. NBC_00102 TaxID=2975652 RepID=UPI00224EBDCF|nr:type I-E CRISPR-associated protein Cse1/CasA [Streptomyces sp. NBC_00102]MCX5398420.1 type I-E CRISPR-associated protein Cse1/CasA [Streptomyces sp. NBC_00102]
MDREVDAGVRSFDLVTEAWLPVQLTDGSSAEFSLRELFAEAGRVRRLVGDVPTQEFALVRLLLAILHDAVDGPTSIRRWRALWEDENSFDSVSVYLEKHRDRFDLLHPVAPFFQVAGLRTSKDEVAALNRIVADVPNGDPFFSMRMPSVERLSYAEAARWVVHAHAYDTSGIKSGAVGDVRVKGGRGYPQGVGWAGNLGGVMAEADDLRRTLLLNLVATDAGLLDVDEEDVPAWCRVPSGPGAGKESEMVSRPTGPRDLYTWQTRRIRLHHDGAGVHGVVLGYGDPLPPRNQHRAEPMTGWRRSEPQEKKHRLPKVFMPREHDPAKAAWRGLESLLFAGAPLSGGRAKEGPESVRPVVLEWVSALFHRGFIPDGLIRARTIGARYGTQQSVIDELVDDGVTLPLVLLHGEDLRYARTAVVAVTDADNAVNALGDLAGDLAQAAGTDRAVSRDAARDQGYGALDGPYRRWLRGLVAGVDLDRARTDWQRVAYRTVERLGRDLLDAATAATWEGRMVDTPRGPEWFDDTRADRLFRFRLGRALPRAWDGPQEAAQAQAHAQAEDGARAQAHAEDGARAQDGPGPRGGPDSKDTRVGSVRADQDTTVGGTDADVTVSEVRT